MIIVIIIPSGYLSTEEPYTHVLHVLPKIPILVRKRRKFRNVINFVVFADPTVSQNLILADK